MYIIVFLVYSIVIQYFCRLYSIIGYYKIMDAPMPHSKSLLFILYTITCICNLVHLICPFPLVTTVFYICEFVSFLYVQLCIFFRFMCI